jgi:hypothetical protein
MTPREIQISKLSHYRGIEVWRNLIARADGQAVLLRNIAGRPRSHHQGDVGDASYAAVPELVRIHRTESGADWNLYAMVAIIELARTESKNPEVPDWLREGYFGSIQELARMGTRDILSANEPETKRAILGVIAIAAGLRTHGKFLMEYSEDELLEMEP